jgi:hypothetical protein
VIHFSQSYDCTDPYTSCWVDNNIYLPLPINGATISFTELAVCILGGGKASSPPHTRIHTHSLLSHKRGQDLFTVPVFRTSRAHLKAPCLVAFLLFPDSLTRARTHTHAQTCTHRQIIILTRGQNLFDSPGPEILQGASVSLLRGGGLVVAATVGEGNGGEIDGRLVTGRGLHGAHATLHPHPAPRLVHDEL